MSHDRTNRHMKKSIFTNQLFSKIFQYITISLFLPIFVMLAQPAHGVQKPLNSGSLIIPANITEENVTIEAWGGGQGGFDGGGGDGGAGGDYSGVQIPSLSSGTYTVTVGSGGSAGSAGGDSSFALGATVLLLAPGGGSTTLPSGNLTPYSGGDGGNARSGGGGGGEAAADNNNGDPGSAPPGLFGTSGGEGGSGNGNGGDGGRGGDAALGNGQNGGIGLPPGGGGGGGGLGAFGSNGFGGNGAAGQVTICYANLTAPSSVCAEATNLSASVENAGAGATYDWTITNGTITAGTGTDSITWTAGASGPAVIEIEVDDGGGCVCSATASVSITTISVTLNGSTSFCSGGSTDITAVPSGGTTPYVYAWGTMGAPGSASGDTYTATGAGLVEVEVTDANSCTGSANVTVTVNDTPDCTISTTSPVCAGETGLTASVSDAGVGATYGWSITGGTITSATDIREITWTAGAAGIANLSVTVTDAGCFCTGSANVTINAAPDCTITAPLSACAGETGLTASVPDAGVGATYGWSITGGTITSATDIREITWTAGAAGIANLSVTVTDAGCFCTNDIDVTVNANDTITLTSAAGTDSQAVSLYDTLTDITYSVGGGATGASIAWTVGAAPAAAPTGVSGAFIAGVFTISGAPEEDGTFDYTVTTSGGPCNPASANGTITVSLTPLPTNDRQALDFDGDGDYVYVSDDSALDLSATGTIEAWIYPTAFTPGAGIVTKGTPDMCYGFGLGDTVADEQKIAFYVFGTGGTEYSLTADKTLEAFQWYHIACVWDSADSMNIYINGISEATSSSIADARTNIQNLRFGINEESVLNTPTYFQGVIDEVRIWNTARPLEVSGADNDIRDFMCKKLDGSEADLAGYWRFDENNSIVVGDWAGNGNIGFIENATRICSQAPIGDDSAFCDYNAATFTVSLGFGSLDDMTVTEDGGTWDSSLDSCLHVYRVDSPPNFTTASLLWKPFNDALRYWGVFKAGGADPTYTMVYHYDGYPITGSENNLQMAYRRHNCEQWKGLNATLNTTTKTLTKEGLSSTEFILGADVDPRNTINYDGTNDYVGISDEASLQLTTIGSLEAWIYADNPIQARTIINKGNSTDGYKLSLNASGNIVLTLYNASTSYVLTSAITISPDIWYHVAATWDTNPMNIYINGVQSNGSSVTGSSGSPSGSLTIGSDSGGTTNFFDGRIDEVRIWDEARSQGDIRTYMCQKIDTRDPNLVGYWRFDEETTSDTSFDFGTVPYNFATMYGFGTATGIITARVCSEAPIGDRSAYSYGSAASATVTHPDGDYFTATKFAGDWGTKFSGLHVYQVDGVPVYPPDISGPLPYNPYVTPNGLTPPYDFSTTPPSWSWSSIDYTRYWGVFTTDWTTTNQPTYDVIYNYGTVGNGNPNVPDEADPSDPNDPQIGLAYRPTYCYGTWTDSNAYWAFGTRQLELLGANSKQQSQNSPSKTNPEYVLGGKNQPLAISLASFTATVADGCIDIFWETATEVDTVGFQLWRSETKNGVYELVPYSYTRSKSVTETRGAAYAFTDCSVVLDGTTDYYYKLEEIDTDNAKENPFYGPIGPVKRNRQRIPGQHRKSIVRQQLFYRRIAVIFLPRMHADERG